MFQREPLKYNEVDQEEADALVEQAKLKEQEESGK